jgi:hypothetical protein
MIVTVLELDCYDDPIFEKDPDRHIHVLRGDGKADKVEEGDRITPPLLPISPDALRRIADLLEDNDDVKEDQDHRMAFIIVRNGANLTNGHISAMVV